jgi:hypothetical protein
MIGLDVITVISGQAIARAHPDIPFPVLCQSLDLMMRQAGVAVDMDESKACRSVKTLQQKEEQ